MNYRSVDHLNRDIQNWATQLPDDIDLIVGVPRSGLLAGNLLALHLNLPLTDVEGLLDGEIIQTGRRYTDKEDFEDYSSAFIVDDSVNTGGTISEIKSQIEAVDLSLDYKYGAVYVSHQGQDYVDDYGQLVPTPRVFEWNMMHHPNLSKWMIDLDGVLCRDPMPSENDDGANYLNFIQNVEPKVIPSEKIGYIVTCRLEKYRSETEAWLSDHGIQYGELIMMDYPDKETRQSIGNHGEYKANIYSNSKAPLFIESNENQAEKIARLTSKPVFCRDANYMLQQGYLGRTTHRAGESIRRVKSNPVRYAQQFYSNPVGFLRQAKRYVFDTS